MLTKKAYSEVYTIISMMSDKLRNNIPQNVLNVIKSQRDKKYNIEIKNIKEYKFSDEANKLLAILYKNYFANNEEKKIIIAKEYFIKANLAKK